MEVEPYLVQTHLLAILMPYMETRLRGGGGGGTCQNFDRDASPIFFGFEIWPNPIFLGWQIF